MDQTILQYDSIKKENTQHILGLTNKTCVEISCFIYRFKTEPIIF